MSNIPRVSSEGGLLSKQMDGLGKKTLLRSEQRTCESKIDLASMFCKAIELQQDTCTGLLATGKVCLHPPERPDLLSERMILRIFRICFRSW